MSSIAISRASPHDLMPAIRLLLGPGDDLELRAEHCLGAFAAGEYDPDGLFVAQDAAGTVIGVALVQVLPGALGVAWPPRGENRGIEDVLTLTACDWLRESGVRVCQAFSTSLECADMAPLERNGFSRVTELVYMRRDVDLEGGWGGSPEVPASCSQGTGAPEPEQIGVLIATHEESLDCPELNGLRTTEEIISSYFPDNQSKNAWWLTNGEEDKPVGVLLFDKGPEPSVLELSYLGLIPSARGRGLGGTALAFVNRIAGESGYRCVSVTVDARNEPALRLYQRHGFVETERRDVFLAVWPAS
jgi:ribosomal protein S18 acetylase RimI-like enzyme